MYTLRRNPVEKSQNFLRPLVICLVVSNYVDVSAFVCTQSDSASSSRLSSPLVASCEPRHPASHPEPVLASPLSHARAHAGLSPFRKMRPISSTLSTIGLDIRPPLLNSSCPWASTNEHLQQLYDCQFTGAVTVRTATLHGFKEDEAVHTVAFSADKTTSLNSYGYSPYPLSTYLTWLEPLLGSQNIHGEQKPVILSITAADAAELEQMLQAIQTLRASLPTSASNLLAIELNTSCPNIPDKPPPAYSLSALAAFLEPLLKACQSDPTLVVGLKLAPFVYRKQMEEVVETISRAVWTIPAQEDRPEEERCTVRFLSCTNTLGGCVMFEAQTSEGGYEGGKPDAMALPTMFGGLAGEPLHYLSLGNVATFSSLLAAHPSKSIRQIGIIGIGGVTTSDAYTRMRHAGASAVACATALGVHGVGVFEKLLGEEDKVA